MRAYELTGRRFGRLEVIGLGPRKGAKRRWVCRCDCGQLALAHTHDLMTGRHTSCGCYQREVVTTHGASTKQHNYRSPEYRAWIAMKGRCYNPATTRFAYYGGRGVSVCDRWRHSFSDFLADMGPRPSPDHSVDRIDANGHYEPTNCRWATRAEQHANMRKRGSGTPQVTPLA